MQKSKIISNSDFDVLNSLYSDLLTCSASLHRKSHMSSLLAFTVHFILPTLFLLQNTLNNIVFYCNAMVLSCKTHIWSILRSRKIALHIRADGWARPTH